MSSTAPNASNARRLAADRLLAAAGRAYQLAFRVACSPEAAEDAVQQGFVSALSTLPPGLSTEEERLWFYGVVTNTARKQVRGELRRRRREMIAVQAFSAGAPGAAPDGELVAALRAALEELDVDHRLPVALCCEQGLTQRQAAAVLELPETTLRRRLDEGLELLRKALTRVGYASAPAAVVGALGHTAPPVPATLAAALENLVSGGAVVKGTGAAAASAAAKGGMAMKIIVGVVAAGVLAGTVAVVNGVGAGFKPAPTTLGSPPAAGSQTSGQPAPINEYKGMQEREEVFEFTQKPAVKKEGDKWVITFATTANCDATVAILDKDGKIVRHLASGVLGKNAPYPFQQNSLSQKLEWDGQTDDFKKAADGCKVKVSLGLKPVFERNIAYDPYFLPNSQKRRKMLLGTAPDGTLYVCALERSANTIRTYGKDGKYLRTAVPPPAAEMEKYMAETGGKTVATTWGDKVPVAGWFGPFMWGNTSGNLEWKESDTVAAAREQAKKNPREWDETVKLIDLLEKRFGAKSEFGPCPTVIPQPAEDFDVKFGERSIMNPFSGKFAQISVDYGRETVYSTLVGWPYFRFDGKNGKLDKAWRPPKGSGGDMPIVGYDDLVYYRSNMDNYGPPFIVRSSQEGQLVPFKENSVDGPKAMEFMTNPKVNKWWAAEAKQRAGALLVAPVGAGGYTTGFHVAPDGSIITKISHQSARDATVFDRDGKLLAADVWTGAPKTRMGDGVYMDREGNVYAVFGGVYPAGQKTLEGTTGAPLTRAPGGSVVKFRGLGGKYPLGSFHIGKDATPPAGALKTNEGSISGALWMYGGVSNQSTSDCGCGKARFWLDRFARSWVPANQAASVMVIDSNGNRIARLGRYGNVDDTEADLKGKKDGLRFVWTRAVCASDTAMYAVDLGNQRILKAALVYAAEETAPVP